MSVDRNTPRTWMRGLSSLSLAVALAVGMPAPQLHAQEAGSEQTDAFNVPAGDLSAALSALAQQGGLTLSVDPDLVSGRSTEGVQGRMTVEEALADTLAGTGLDFRLDQGRTLTLSKAAGQTSDGTFQLAPLNVEAVPQSSDYGRDDRYQPFDSSFVTGGTTTPLRNVPFSATVVDQDFLRDNNSKRLDRTAPYVAGLQTGNQSNNTSQVFQSRGFQLGRDGILINGTRQADAFAITPEQLVSSLEFYRGPSSILSGATPPGGAANIITKKPLPQAFTRLEATYDSHEQRELAADYNSGQQQLGGLPVSFRFNAVGEDSNSFRDAVERENVALAPVATLQLSPDTRMTLEANIIDWEATDDRGLPLVGSADGEAAADRFETSDFLLGTTDEINDREQQRYMLDLSHQSRENISTNLQATYGETTRSQFAVFPVQFDASTDTLARAHFGTEDEFESTDIRLDTLFELDTGILTHEALAAVQYRGFKRTDNFTSFVSPADTVDVRSPETDKPFLADSGPAGGVQGDNESRELLLQDSVSVNQGILEGGRLMLGTRYIDFNEETDESLDENEWVSRLGLGYTPPALPLTTFYGSFSESFNTQSGTTADGGSVGPSEGEQWELGVKSEILDGGLTLTLAYFQLENTNVAVADPNNPGASLAVGRQENDGVELEAVGTITSNLQVQGQYTRNDSVIRDDPQRNGNELQLAPENSASLWLRYDVPEQSAAGDLAVFGGVSHVGSRYTDIDNQIELDSYSRADLGARYTFMGGTSAELNVLNVLDERYFTGGNAFGLGSITPGQARTIEVSVSHEF